MRRNIASIAFLLITLGGGALSDAEEDPTERQSTVDLDDLLGHYRHLGSITERIRLSGPRRCSALMGHWAEDYLRRNEKVEMDCVVRRTSAAARRLLDEDQVDCCLTVERLTERTTDDKSEKDPDGVRRLLVAFDLYEFVVHGQNAVPAIPRAKIERLMETWPPGLMGAFLHSHVFVEQHRLPWSAIWEHGSAHKIRFVAESELHSGLPPSAGDAEIIAEAAKDFFVLGMVRRQPLPDTVRAVPIRRGDEVVEPTSENALSGKYALGYRVYLVYPVDANRAVLNFVEYVWSAEGQAQIEAAGLMSVPR